MTYKTILASMTLMLVMVSGVYANPDGECRHDADQMKADIYKYRSIHSSNGFELNDIYEPVNASSPGRCSGYAKGYLAFTQSAQNRAEFLLSWKVHNWRKRLDAIVL
ncbi:hypothetical protein [Candidatus Sororendozoicomonas aggregata]|uniref:hypothetical protein n=1 Tax=Candidatus Sororendozoicomonas aggregata TaxID=3073239 RepID=UPI002ED1DFCA